MNRFDINCEKSKWEHPYRIQVTKPLNSYELNFFLANNTEYEYAIERRGSKFVVWRQPEQEWDVDKASLEWFEDWTSKTPPSKKAIAKTIQPSVNKGNKSVMTAIENRWRRDEAIRTEFNYLRGQGFTSGHVYKVLAEKYYLSPLRVRDLVTSSKEKMLKSKSNRH